ncbi:30S ribosomal protein S8 [Wolbachia pipientis]|uniref:Small ribosomal subunit protein uS8 n=2 Tax=Wolbachia pipientis TaxID=955 RepID=A0A1E7QJ73_WOLPI|nr:30S ribosomal protein S8 [Wolbachia pipientis]
MHKTTKVLFSKVNAAILEILKNEGYILDYQKQIIDNISSLSVKLKYHNRLPVIRSIVRVSKPGCRRYSQYKDIGKVYNGLGISIISTSQGIIADHDAHRLKIGGEILCCIF